MDLCVGLEIEWYLLRVSQEELGEDNIGFPGARGQPIKTAPAEPGFSYHSESNMDLMQPVLSALTEHFETIGLPLRSIENEWGPGQLECTFAARPALEAAASWSACSARREIKPRDWRTGSASPRPIPTSLFFRRSWPDLTASNMGSIRDRPRMIPITPSFRRCPRTYPRPWTRSSANRCFAASSATYLSIITSNSSATRAGRFAQWLNETGV